MASSTWEVPGQQCLWEQEMFRTRSGVDGRLWTQPALVTNPRPLRNSRAQCQNRWYSTTDCVPPAEGTSYRGSHFELDGATCRKDRIFFWTAHVLGSSRDHNLEEEFGDIHRIGIAACRRCSLCSHIPSAHLWVHSQCQKITVKPYS